MAKYRLSFTLGESEIVEAATLEEAYTLVEERHANLAYFTGFEEIPEKWYVVQVSSFTGHEDHIVSEHATKEEAELEANSPFARVAFDAKLIVRGEKNG